MVADPAPDVLIPALTWAYVAAAVTVHDILARRRRARVSGWHRL